MVKNWIDHEGRLRLEHDENFQMVHTVYEDGYVWLKMDSWDVELACKMIVLGYNENVKSSIDYGLKHCPDGATGRDRADALITVMSRILTLAKSAIAIGTLKDPDTPVNWITWAEGKGYSVTHLMPDVIDETEESVIDTTPADDDPDKALSNLFDPVPVEMLEKMFPANGSWTSWTGKAKANGLIAARQERAKFNPYIAGRWFVLKGAKDWDNARLNRTLAKNLPARSRDEAWQLTGEMD